MMDMTTNHVTEESLLGAKAAVAESLATLVRLGVKTETEAARTKVVTRDLVAKALRSLDDGDTTNADATAELLGLLLGALAIVRSRALADEVLARALAAEMAAQ